MKILNDADRETLLKIPIVIDVNIDRGILIVLLDEFTATEVDGKGDELYMKGGGTIEISRRNVYVRHIHHPNVNVLSATLCWGTHVVEQLAEKLLQGGEYVALINLICEFLQSYHIETPRVRPPQRCDTCAFYSPLATCEHPSWNEHWTVPTNSCRFHYVQ